MDLTSLARAILSGGQGYAQGVTSAQQMTNEVRRQEFADSLAMAEQQRRDRQTKQDISGAQTVQAGVDYENYMTRDGYKRGRPAAILGADRATVMAQGAFARAPQDVERLDLETAEGIQEAIFNTAESEAAFPDIGTAQAAKRAGYLSDTQVSRTRQSGSNLQFMMNEALKAGGAPGKAADIQLGGQDLTFLDLQQSLKATPARHELEDLTLNKEVVEARRLLANEGFLLGDKEILQAITSVRMGTPKAEIAEAFGPEVAEAAEIWKMAERMQERPGTLPLTLSTPFGGVPIRSEDEKTATDIGIEEQRVGIEATREGIAAYQAGILSVAQSNVLVDLARVGVTMNYNNAQEELALMGLAAKYVTPESLATSPELALTFVAKLEDDDLMTHATAESIRNMDVDKRIEAVLEIAKKMTEATTVFKENRPGGQWSQDFLDNP